MNDDCECKEYASSNRFQFGFSTATDCLRASVGSSEGSPADLFSCLISNCLAENNDTRKHTHPLAAAAVHSKQISIEILEDDDGDVDFPRGPGIQ